MKITKRGEYALRALICLGTAQKQGHKAVSLSSLAVIENLPVKFLRGILFNLRHAGFVEQIRGKPRGIRLAKSMDAIRIGDVVRLMDGDLAPIACISDLNYATCSCPHEDACGVRMLMIDVHQAILSILDRYSLQQLVDAVARRQKHPCMMQSNRQTSLTLSQKRHADSSDGFLSSLLDHAAGVHHAEICLP